MLLIRADGTERDVDGHLTLESARFLVGGYVQHVPLPDGRYLLMDEDGKSSRKPFNRKATELFYPDHDYVVGDVLVLTAEEFARWGNIRGFKPRGSA